jgi:hypothetical protein
MIEYSDKDKLNKELPQILEHLNYARNIFWSAFWRTGSEYTNPVMKPIDDVIVYLTRLVLPVGLFEDSGEWELDEFSSRPQEGMRHYTRMLVFKRKPSEKELEIVKMWLQHDNCPGWTKVDLLYKHGNTWAEARTTMDSSG